jgi:hypothetical protein
VATIDPNDGLVADVVGPWASEKHERLKKYIDAYRSARAMFLPPKGTGGAAYIDLFSRPGRPPARNLDLSSLDRFEGNKVLPFCDARS